MKEKTLDVFLKYIHVQKTWCAFQMNEISFLIRKKKLNPVEKNEKIVI